MYVTYSLLIFLARNTIYSMMDVIYFYNQFNSKA
jgi:hypothetical protein